MAKSYDTLIKNEDTWKETNFELLSNGTLFLLTKFSNYLEFLTVYSNWLSGDSNFARYLDKWKYAVLILEAIDFSES